MHLTDDAAQRFLSAQLSREENSSVVRHLLTGCPACLALLQGMRGGSPPLGQQFEERHEEYSTAETQSTSRPAAGRGPASFSKNSPSARTSPLSGPRKSSSAPTFFSLRSRAASVRAVINKRPLQGAEEHPSPQVIARFLDGWSSPEDARQVVRHLLSRCQTCLVSIRISLLLHPAASPAPMPGRSTLFWRPPDVSPVTYSFAITRFLLQIEQHLRQMTALTEVARQDLAIDPNGSVSGLGRGMESDSCEGDPELPRGA